MPAPEWPAVFVAHRLAWHIPFQLRWPSGLPAHCLSPSPAQLPIADAKVGWGRVPQCYQLLPSWGLIQSIEGQRGWGWRWGKGQNRDEMLSYGMFLLTNFKRIN